MSGPIRSLVDGATAQSLPLGDRALHYGDGVFRTLLLWQGQVVWQEQQLQQLHADAERIGLSPPGMDCLARDLRRLVQGQKEGAVKLILTAGDSPRGYARGNSPCRRLALLNPLPDWPRQYWRDGISIASLALRLASQPALAGAKHLNRLEQVLARQQWPDGCQEGVLANAAGELICGTMSNVFWYESGGWHTPPIEDCGIRGVTRHRLLALVAGAQQTRRACARIARSSEAVFLSNSLIGIWPVQSWDGRRLAWPPESVASLQEFRMSLAHPLAVAHS